MQGQNVTLTGVNYRYGFNAQENDDEVKGQSNSMGAEFGNMIQEVAEGGIEILKVFR